jgi:hypothetical protein
MKKTIIAISIFFLFLVGCKGSLNESGLIDFTLTHNPTTSIEGQSVHFLDRRWIRTELDISDKNCAKVRIYMLDKLQIGQRVYDVPWEFGFMLNEGQTFRIIRQK